MAMKLQPREDVNRHRAARRDWSVEPALSANGRSPMVLLRLGRYFTIFLPVQAAISIANALIDAVEDEETTIYRHKSVTKHNSISDQINTENRKAT